MLLMSLTKITLFVIKIQLTILLKIVMKQIVMIIEASKIKQFLVKLVRVGQLYLLKIILELQKNIQILVLVTITIVETLMEQKEFGVIRLTQI